MSLSVRFLRMRWRSSMDWAGCPRSPPCSTISRRILIASGLRYLPILLDHAKAAGELPLDHRDPFDRLLIAQARIEDAVLVSNEKLFDQFGVRRLW